MTACEHLGIGHDLSRQLLGENHAVEVRVTGTSMTPTLRGGDVVTLVPAARQAPRIGDVVAFLRGGRWLVIHRLVGKRDDHWLARGDAAPAADAPLSSSEILGRVTGAMRAGRPVRFGLGPGRFMIALLSRAGCWRPIVRCGARLRARRAGRVEA